MRRTPKALNFSILILLIALVAVACSGGQAEEAGITPTAASEEVEEVPEQAEEPADAESAEGGEEETRADETSTAEAEAEVTDAEEDDPGAEEEPAESSIEPAGELNLSWNLTNIGEGIKPAFALDSSDNAHVAYLTEESVGGVFYATNASGSFEIETVAEGYFYGPVDLGISQDDVPFIAYHDHQDPNTFNPNLGDEVVAIAGPDGWQLVVVEDVGHDGWDNSIVVDSQGNWHTAAIDPAQFGSESGVEYATSAGGSVSVTAVGSGPINYEFGTAIQLDNDELPGIAYYDQAEKGLEYAKFDGSQWTVELVDNNGDAGRYASLVYDAANNPHISYFVFDGERTGEVRHAWLDGGSWQFEVVDRLDDVLPGRTGARKITALALGENDELHIAYSDRNRVVYGQQNEDGWLLQELPKNSDKLLGQLVELEIDSQGMPHLIWYEVTVFAPTLIGDIIYAAPA